METQVPTETQLESILESYFQQFEKNPDVTVTVEVNKTNIQVRRIKSMVVSATGLQVDVTEMFE